MSKTRREFLKSSLLAGGAVVTHADIMLIVAAILKGTVKNAYAAQTGVTSKNYVNFHLEQGPPRWHFDQWLTPNPTDITLALSNPATWNNAFATNYNNNVPEYNTFTYQGLRLPVSLQGKVPGANGAQRNVTDLINHMGVVRGYNSNTDGHTVNTALHTFPDPAVPSIGGIASDYRQDAISAVTAGGGTFLFKSGLGKTLTKLTSGTNPIVELLSPFRKFHTASPALNDAYFKDIKNSVGEILKQIASESDASTASVLADHTKSALEMIEFTKEDLPKIWSDLVNKYQTLMNQAIRIDNELMGNDPIFYTNAEATANSNIVRTMAIDANWDLREMISHNDFTMSRALVISLAMTEYCLTRGMTGVIGGGCNGAMLENVKIVSGGVENVFALGSDQHFDSTKACNILSLAYSRGLSAGLLELVTTLKSTQKNGQSIFDNTVIHITGDFPRSPRDNGTGTDHAWNGQVTSVIAPQITTPTIVGNISSSGSPGYTGCWGLAAPVDFNGSTETLSPRHAAAAVAHLLGVQNPWKFTHLVWEMQNGVLVKKIGTEIK